MPQYLYEVITQDGSAGERFEVSQAMSEPALTSHPVTGQAVRRVYVAPNLTTRYSSGATRKRLDDKNVAKAGFTKYVRDRSTGTYHKTAGHDPKAPAVLNPHQLA